MNYNVNGLFGFTDELKALIGTVSKNQPKSCRSIAMDSIEWNSVFQTVMEKMV